MTWCCLYPLHNECQGEYTLNSQSYLVVIDIAICFKLLRYWNHLDWLPLRVYSPLACATMGGSHQPYLQITFQNFLWMQSPQTSPKFTRFGQDCQWLDGLVHVLDEIYVTSSTCGFTLQYLHHFTCPHGYQVFFYWHGPLVCLFMLNLLNLQC